VSGRSGVLPCRPDDHGASGSVDERARRLSHEELAVARQLAAEGHRVRSLPERGGAGPTADMEACGVPVEVKSFLRAAGHRGGRGVNRGMPTAWSVYNKLAAAKEQAPVAVVYGRGSGLRAEVARRGVERFARDGRHGAIKSVRVLGDGFDLSWNTLRREPPAVSRSAGL
jgi:hypothetical protein